MGHEDVGKDMQNFDSNSLVAAREAVQKQSEIVNRQSL